MFTTCALAGHYSSTFRPSNMIQETSENKVQNLSRTSFFKINGFVSNISPILEFLNFLAIGELRYTHYISFNGITIEQGYSLTLKSGPNTKCFRSCHQSKVELLKKQFLMKEKTRKTCSATGTSYHFIFMQRRTLKITPTTKIGEFLRSDVSVNTAVFALCKEKYALNSRPVFWAQKNILFLGLTYFFPIYDINGPVSYKTYTNFFSSAKSLFALRFKVRGVSLFQNFIKKIGIFGIFTDC